MFTLLHSSTFESSLSTPSGDAWETWRNSLDLFKPETEGVIDVIEDLKKKNLRTFWLRVPLRCYKFIVYDNTFLHFKKPGLYSRVCSCQWNIQWLSICWLIISDLFFLFKLLVLQNQLFRWERLPTLTVNWNKFCIFTHLILRNPCCNVALVKYGKNHNYFDLIFFLILETNMKIMSKMSQSLETSDLWPTVTWLGWNQIQTVLVQHWTNLQFS